MPTTTSPREEAPRDPDEAPLDGRAARAQRTKVAVVDAMLALIHEGELRPTAPRIAERAGVSLRSVFQHFDDMEALLATASQRSLERIRSLIEPHSAEGTRAERITAWVDQRARLYEAISPIRRASALQEPFSPGLRAARDKAFVISRRDLERVFAVELGPLSAAERATTLEAIQAGTIWESWEHLRVRIGLSPQKAAAVFERTLDALLPG